MCGSAAIGKMLFPWSHPSPLTLTSSVPPQESLHKDTPFRARCSKVFSVHCKCEMGKAGISSVRVCWIIAVWVARVPVASATWLVCGQSPAVYVLVGTKHITIV